MPEVGALWAGLFSAGLNSHPNLTHEGFPSQAPWAASSQLFPAGTTSFRALRWEQKGLGGGGASWWEPLPLPELSASSPARPAVWPWFLSRLLPVLPLTDIVSMGIYISLTTLSPNGIKSKASDK